MNKILWEALGLLGLGLLWMALHLAMGDALVPGPWKVLVKAWDILPSTLGPGLITLLRTLAGFSLALGLSLIFGILMGRRKTWAQALFLPSVMVQAAPPILWAIPLLLVLGTDGLAPVGVVFLVVLPLGLFAFKEALAALPLELLDVMKIYAPRRFLVLRELYLPVLTPALRSTLTLGILMGLKSALLGEFLGAQDGLGRLLYEAYTLVNMTHFYAVALIYLVGAGLLMGLVQWGSQKILPLRRPSPPSKPPRGPGTLPHPAPSALKIRDLEFSFPGKPLLQGVNLTLNPGEILVLSGDSGAGKTTLARLALGLLKPKTGQILGPSKPGVLFQEDGLLPHRDALGNANLGPWAEGHRDSVLAWEALKAVGLESEAFTFPAELSGGMKKRLALARVLARRPDFLVLDEPFQNLHPEARTALWDLVFRLIQDQGLPTLIITHHPQDLRDRPCTFAHLQDRRIKILPSV